MSASQARQPNGADVPVVVALIDMHTNNVDALDRGRWLRRTVASLSSIYTNPRVEPVEVVLPAAAGSDLVATSCFLTEDQAEDVTAAQALGLFLHTFTDSAERRRAGVLIGDTYYGIAGNSS